MVRNECQHDWTEYRLDQQGDSVRECIECGIEQYCDHEQIGLDEQGYYCMNCVYSTSYPAPDYTGASGDDDR